MDLYLRFRLCTSMLFVCTLQMLTTPNLQAQGENSKDQSFQRELISNLYESDVKQVFRVDKGTTDDEIENMQTSLRSEDFPVDFKVKRASSAEIVYFEIKLGKTTCISDDFGSALIIKSVDGKGHCSIRTSRE